MRTNMITISLWDLEVEESVLCSISPVNTYLVLFKKNKSVLYKRAIKNSI